jgi:hypothetical protein
MSKFQHLYNLGDTYTLDSLPSQNLCNQEMSESTNPHHFSSPFSGVLVTLASHNLIINFISIYSATKPNGYLYKAWLKTFFGVSGPNHGLK